MIRITYKDNLKIQAALVALAAVAVYVFRLQGGFTLGDSLALNLPGQSFAGLSYAIDSLLWGTNAFGFLLSNAVLHAANALLVFVLGRMMFEDQNGIAFVGAMFFALHPANTEAVSWIAARAELLYTLFIMLSVISFAYFVRHGKASGALLCALFAILSFYGSQKALSIIAVIPLYALIVADSSVRKRSFIAAAAISFIVVVSYMVLSNRFPGALEFSSLKWTVAEIVAGLGYYLLKIFLPLKLVLFPQVPANPLYHLWTLCVAASIVFLYKGGYRAQAFLVAYALVMLLPSFFEVSVSGSLLGEKHIYASSVGYSILLASLLYKLKNRNVLVFASVLIVVLYAFGTVSRVADWSAGGQRLWGNALEAGTDDYYENPVQASSVLTLLGASVLANGEAEKAEKYLVEALRADDGNLMAYHHVRRVYDEMQRRYETEKNISAQRALAQVASATLAKAVKHFPGSFSFQYDLGIWYIRANQFDRAEETFRNLLRMRPPPHIVAASGDFLAFIESVKRRGLFGYNATDAGSDKKPKRP